MRAAVRIVVALGVVAGLVWVGLWLHETRGSQASFTLILGAAFGAMLQRSRFCGLCIMRDFFERRDSRPLLGMLAALAVGSVGYMVIFGSRIPDPSLYSPWEAHIGPAGWHLLLGGFIFGVGMSLSGSCISAHLYRVGEGSLLAPVALLGSVAGFILGFHVWNPLYSMVVATAPPVWLPERIGYLGAFAVQMAVLAVTAAVLLRWVKPQVQVAAGSEDGPPRLRTVWEAVFVRRWPTWIGGVGVGLIATFAYLRVDPLGVTAELNRLSQGMAQRVGAMPPRLEGLEGSRGCVPAEAGHLIGDNGVFVLALMAAALCMGLLAGQFRPKRESPTAVGLALVGGVMLGFGAMISLGCTIGTLLSGVHAFALSGWIFTVGVPAGVWAGLRLRRVIKA
jgi:uncharacterized protein